MTTQRPKRSTQIHVRVDPELKARLTEAAGCSGMDLSAWLRDLAIERADLVLPIVERARAAPALRPFDVGEHVARPEADR